MTTSGLHPLTKTLEAVLPALGTDVEATYAIGRAPIAGLVSAVSYTPVADVTGAATNNRKLELINKGANGNGTTVVATLTYGSGTNSTDFDETAFTLSVVALATVVAAGDILAVASTAPGTGIADPGGLVTVSIARD